MTPNINGTSLSCDALVLIEVDMSTRAANSGHFVREAEAIYRRLGTGDFGRLLSMLHQDKLLMSLGRYADVPIGGEGQITLADGFRRHENWSDDFVII